MKKLFHFYGMFIIMVASSVVTHAQTQKPNISMQATDSTVAVSFIAYREDSLHTDYYLSVEFARDDQFIIGGIQSSESQVFGSIPNFNFNYEMNFDTLSSGTWYVRGRVSYPGIGVILYSDTLSFIVTHTSVGIAPAGEVSAIVYPNPIHSQFSVKGIDEDYMITIYDQIGKMVFKGMRPRGDSEPFTLDSVPAGIYSYRIDTGHNGIISGKLAIISQ